MSKVEQIQLNAELFDKCIKWAIRKGFEPNYCGDGKWYMEDEGKTWSNKKVFEEYIKQLK